MEELLTEIHKKLGAVAGEIAICLSLRKVQGGKPTLKKWSYVLREVAKMIDDKLESSK